MNEIIGYIIAIIIGSIICISFTFGCFALLEKWGREIEELQE